MSTEIVVAIAAAVSAAAAWAGALVGIRSIKMQVRANSKVQRIDTLRQDLAQFLAVVTTSSSPLPGSGAESITEKFEELTLLSQKIKLSLTTSNKPDENLARAVRTALEKWGEVLSEEPHHSTQATGDSEQRWAGVIEATNEASAAFFELREHEFADLYKSRS